MIFFFNSGAAANLKSLQSAPAFCKGPDFIILEASYLAASFTNSVYGRWSRFIGLSATILGITHQLP